MPAEHVLVVTPDDRFTGEIVPALRREDASVRSAPDVVSALMAARRQSPDLVVVDHDLAGGGGPSLLRRLRSLTPTALTPAVGIADEEPDARALRDAGAQAIAGRPIDADDFLALAREALDADLRPERAPREVLGEADRMTALRETGLLDSGPEEVFDHLTRLAAALLPAPVSLVSLVDQDRQFFKSTRTSGGWDPGRGERETDLSYSFCQWAVTSEEPLVVSDARSHPLLRHNRAVDERGVVAYAGVPLVVAGQALGTVCAVDDRPRDWDDDDLVLLRDLAGIAQAEIGLRHLGKTRAGEGGDGEDDHALTARALACVADLMRRGRRDIGDEEMECCSGLVEHFASRLEARETQ